MSDDSDPGGHGVAYVDMTGDMRICVRRRDAGLLAMTITRNFRGYRVTSDPVTVDLGAFLVDLQLTAADCKRALDGFGNQGFDRPDDATEPTP